jgi:chalcone isomerase-like protein
LAAALLGESENIYGNGAMMKRNILLVLISMIAVLSVKPARAKDCKGVSFPDSLQLDGRALTLNGLGLRQATMLKVNVYVAALYVTKPSADANALLGSSAPKQLILQFVRNVSAAELNKAWEEGFDKRLAPFKSHLETLKGWMADMKTGQRLTFVHRPGSGLEVDVNGAAKGTIKGDEFAKAFFSIWLGANTPNPDLKSGLLGGACG